ncbi:hypothetical protein PP1Y_AT28965 [Novosphingobium sp. PP1Y]|nr:hypothetical protein PP1Y_AT28965 [Novosphingobium sp. PP1Y]
MGARQLMLFPVMIARKAQECSHAPDQPGAAGHKDRGKQPRHVDGKHPAHFKCCKHEFSREHDGEVANGGNRTFLRILRQYQKPELLEWRCHDAAPQPLAASNDCGRNHQRRDDQRDLIGFEYGDESDDEQ